MSGDQPPPDPWASPLPPGESPPASPPPPPVAPPSPYAGSPYSPTPSAPTAGSPVPYGYGYPYGYGPQAPPSDLPRRTDAVSVAALVCGCLLLFPLAVVLGVVGVVRTNRPELSGRGLAVAGIVLGVLGGVVGLVVTASVLFLNSDAGQEVVGLATGDTVYVNDLARGDCFQAPAGGDLVTVIDTVDCALPHDLEVFVVDEVFATSGPGSPYPGQEDVADRADEDCKAAFETFVGTPYDDSSLDFFTIYPSEETWDRLDDRTVVCSVGDPDTTTTGTLEGARR